METSVPAGMFYGKTVARREVAGFRFSETHYPPSLEIPKHFHACANFCLVLHGSYAEVSEGRPRTCQPSTVVFHPQGEVHSDQHDPVAVRIFCVEIEIHRLEILREHAVALDMPADFQGGAEAHLGVRLYHEFQEADAVAELALEGLTLEMLAQASRRVTATFDRQPPRWLREARDLLHTEYVTPPSLEKIARTVGVHPMHLAREFRRYYHGTMAECVRGLRVEDACRLLTTTQQPLGEIALSAGFADQSHFSRTFRRLVGMTPAAYRRLHTVR